MDLRGQLLSIVKTSVRNVPIKGKCGQNRLHELVATALRQNGFVADKEDSREFLRKALPVWRSKDDCKVEPTRRRRHIDIVVYSDDNPVGLIEIESDLDDLKEAGVTKRRGHYDVFSISRSGSGSFYNSYKSLERMAAAAFYWARRGQSDSDLTPLAQLEEICADLPEIHNPAGLAIVLVSGRCRRQDFDILEQRLASLSADLVCVSG